MNQKDKKRAEKKKQRKKVGTKLDARKKAEDKLHPLPDAKDLPTREQLAGLESTVMADMVEAIRTGKYNPQKHIEEVMARHRKRAQYREAEIILYEMVKDTPATPWKGKDTPFEELMWFQASTWSDFKLFDVPPMPHDGPLVDVSKYAVKCPGTNFVYANKTLPLSYSLSTAVHRKKQGRVFFDGPITTPVLFEQKGPEEDFRQVVWMGLTPMEMITQKKGIDMASGKVVVGGLGLGWFLSEIAAKPEVEEIIVVDRLGPLIEWLRPVLEEKFPAIAKKVKQWIAADVYEYMAWDTFGKKSKTKYLLDIWPTFGDVDYDHKFVQFESMLTEDRLWGWGRGATFNGEPAALDPHQKLPYPRAYVRKNPCSGCPFSKTGDPTKGGTKDPVNPLRLIGQARGPFMLPCHEEPNYMAERQGTTYQLAQCAGGAIYRSNTGIADMFPAAFHILPEDKDKVYGTPAELYAGYTGCSATEADGVLKATPPEVLLQAEMDRQEVRVYGYKKS